MTALVQSLARMGHRRIGYLSGPDRLYVCGERERGYRQALAAERLELDPRLVVTTSVDSPGGADGGERLLAEAPDVTAVACANDLQALGALERLAQLGISVPGELSVAGFDDIPAAARTNPPLSTVKVPLRSLGAAGFRLAEKILDGRRPHRQLMPFEVMLRASTASPRPGTLHLSPAQEPALAAHA
jgi:DNA-binding LacI/PurR family transcriptional regulator